MLQAGLFLVALSFATPTLANEPVFSSDGSLTSDTGHVLVEWQADEPVSLSLAREDGSGEQTTLYAGTAQAYFLSGLANGRYTLHLEGQSGVTAKPVALTVAHQSLSQALWLTLIGLVITVAIIATILRGARDD